MLFRSLFDCAGKKMIEDDCAGKNFNCKFLPALETETSFVAVSVFYGSYIEGYLPSLPLSLTLVISE